LLEDSVTTLEIPGRGLLEIAHLILDLNGTLAADGRVSPAVADRVRSLASAVQIHILTADTFGTAAELVVTTIQDALDLFRFPRRLVASLRTA
jgi:soluble P-type ATPase